MSPVRCALPVLLALLAGACNGGGEDPSPAGEADADTDTDTDSDTDADTDTDTAPPPDTTPPGPLTELAAPWDGVSALAVSWLNPGDADLAGALIVAREGAAVSFAPTDGETYTAGDDLGDGQAVLLAELGEATSISRPAIGAEVHLSGWAYDESLNYSEVASVIGSRIALGEQRATLELDLASGVATVTQQPAELTLSVGALAYDPETQAAEVALSVQNDTPRLLFNLKAVTDALAAGTQESAGLWTEDDRPYLYFGPGALLPGAAAEQPLQLSGLDGKTDPVTVELYFLDAPMIYGANYGGDFGWLDASMSGQLGALRLDEEAGLAWELREGDVSPDGRYLYAAEKSSPFVTVIDTTDLSVSAGPDLVAGGKKKKGKGDDTGGEAEAEVLAHVGGVAASADGAAVFAALTEGATWLEVGEGGLTTVWLVELDPETLEERRRLELRADDKSARSGRSVQLSPDGATAAVLSSSAAGTDSDLWLIDLAKFSVIGGAVRLTGAGFAERLAWSSDGSTLAVGFNNHYSGDGRAAELFLIDASTGAALGLDPARGGAVASVFAEHDNRLYYTSRQSSAAGLSIVDMLTGEESAVGTGFERATGAVIDAASDRYWVFSYGEAQPMRLSDDTVIDADGEPTNTQNALLLPEDFRANFLVITPF